MSYVKYREDDIKIIDNRFFMRRGSDVTPRKKESIRYYDCKYCNAVFTDQKELFHHIKQSHHIFRPLIVINGKIAGDSYNIHYIDSAYIELFGYHEPIYVNNVEIDLGYKEEIDIAPLLKKIFSEKNRCVITFESGSVEINLIKYSVENSQAVISTIEQWEKDVSSGQILTERKYNRHLLDDGTCLFLDGMYNYYIACRAKNDKAKRYDDAFAILSSFNDLDGIGNCVLKIVAFRRNWISKLDMLSSCDNDIFTIATDYYLRRKSDLTDSFSGKQIYIEDSTKMSLDNILLFQRGEYDVLRERLHCSDDYFAFNDLNLEDQYYLLNARLAAVEDDKAKAKYYYGQVITPFFKNEAELYSNGLVSFRD